MYYECKSGCTELLADLTWLREQFLSARLNDALENRREEEATNIQTIIRDEN